MESSFSISVSLRGVSTVFVSLENVFWKKDNLTYFLSKYYDWVVGDR
jgi:hypothetical protein